MYLIDTDMVRELLYKRARWRECYEFLNKVKADVVKSYILHFTVHGISATLGDPRLVSRFLSEIAGGGA